MLGKRSDQRGLWEADHLYLDLVGRDSFYGRLAGLREQLFRDEDFAALYCQDNGRSSVPPSLLATALLLQAHDRVSDAEAPRQEHIQDGIPHGAPFRLDGPPLRPLLRELWVQQFSWATGQISGLA